MARKPTDYVQVKVRMREALRRKLEKAAEKKAISTNAEAIERIEYTFAEEEHWETQQKEMEERRDEIDQQAREYYEEQAKREAEYEAALRDSRLITMLAGSADGAMLLRVMLWYMQENEGWNSSREKRIELANKIHSFLLSGDDLFEGK